MRITTKALLRRTAAFPRFRAPDPSVGLGAAGLFAGFLVWELLGHTLDWIALPPVSAVARRLVELTLSGQIIGSLGGSLLNLAIALPIALGLGAMVGIIMGLSRTASAALDPYVNALMTAPSLVFAPIFFSIWGLGRGPIVVLIVTYAIFVMIVNTQAAVRAVDRDLLEMAHSFSATRAQLLLFVTVPAAAPLMFAGIRVAVSRSVRGMINAEMFIALIGLGSLLVESQRKLDASGVYAVLAVIVGVSLLLIHVVDRVDRRLTSWLPSASRGG